jgi:hypothetical protein
MNSTINSLKDAISKTEDDEELKKLKSELKEAEKRLEEYMMDYYADGEEGSK